MIADKKYEVLFNDYAERIKGENLSTVTKCSMSIKLSEILFGVVVNVDGAKPIKHKDILVIGLVSESTDKELELHRQVYINNKNAKAVIHAFPPNSCVVGDVGVNIPPLLDDMAQIIGPTAKGSDNDYKSIMKVLKKRNACMIKGNGLLTYGRTLDEAYVGCLVLEKSAKAFIDVTVLGKYNKINFIESRLMHFVYQKKYSKQNQKLLEGKLVDIEDKKESVNNYSEKELELRHAIVDAGKRLLKSNLVQGTWGNISIRLDDNYMLITPSGLDYLSLGVDDIVKVNMDTMEYQGKHKPSGEKDIHAILLKSRKDISVVMHSHPTECSALAAARMDLPVMSDEMQKYVGGDAKVSAYALPSTMGLAKATVKAIEGRNSCLMANHGMLSVGATVDSTFETCRVMEESAKAFIDKKADEQSLIKGTPADKRRDIFSKFYNKK